MGTRRGNGEGTIYQRPDGTWRGQATIAGRRVGVSGKTRREVQTGVRQLLGDADRGVLPPPERRTLGQHLEQWLEHGVRHTRRPRTWQTYRERARLYVLPSLGRVRLTQLEPAHLQRLYGELLARGLAPQTVHHAHSLIRAALGQAVAWGLIPRNVATLVKAPRVERAEIPVLDAAQARQLRVAAGATRWGPLIAVALATGMRQGELLGLQWGDVDLDAGLIRVRRQLGRDKTLAEVKTAKGRRSIDVPASTVTILREHRRRQNEARLYLGPEYEHRDLVFCTHTGRPLGYRNVTREYKKLLRRADLPAVPFHALRHTNATLLLLQGEHPKVVQERLGHSTVAMTMDIYSHLIPSMGKAAADKLEALLA
jgi:integrase